MAQLPQFNTSDRVLSMLQTQWGSQLNPLLASPIVQGREIADIKVTTGVNTINHLLGQKLRGYIVTLNNSNVTFYDNQSTNPNPAQTLKLVASGPAIISLWVF